MLEGAFDPNAIETAIKVLQQKNGKDRETIEFLSQSMANPNFITYFEENKKMGRKLFIESAHQLTKISTGNDNPSKAKAVHAIITDQLTNQMIPALRADIPYNGNRDILRKFVSAMFSAAAKGFGDPAISADDRSYIGGSLKATFTDKLQAIDFEALNYLSESKDIDTEQNIPHKLLAGLGKSLTLNNTVDDFSVAGLEVFKSLAQNAYVQKHMTRSNKDGAINLITPHIATVKEGDRIDIYATSGTVALIGSSILHKNKLKTNLPLYQEISDREQELNDTSAFNIQRIKEACNDVSMKHYLSEFQEVVLSKEFELPYYRAMQKGIKSYKLPNGEIRPLWSAASKQRIISYGI